MSKYLFVTIEQRQRDIKNMQTKWEEHANVYVESHNDRRMIVVRERVSECEQNK